MSTSYAIESQQFSEDEGPQPSKYIKLSATSQRAAMAAMREYLSTHTIPSNTKVYLTFSRSEDDQSGYINPNGSADICGRAWGNDPGRPTEVIGGKTRRLYAGEDDWQWLVNLGDGEPSEGLRRARAAIDKR